MKIVRNVLQVLRNLFTKNRYPKITTMSADETIDYIIKNKCSIGRYGDGELDIINGKSIGFQSASVELSTKLSNIMNTKNFLVCLPSVFSKRLFNRKIITPNEYAYWKKYKLLNEFKWRKLFGSKSEIYGDAFISRFYLRYNDKSNVDKYVHKLKKLWDGLDVLIVEGKNSQVGVGNDILDNAKSISRIICPQEDAYAAYDKIFCAIKKNYNPSGIVLLALGPTATVLAYELSKENIWALDMGHFDIEYEWYLAKTDKKIPVKNKHVNECGVAGKQLLTDKKYTEQIIDSYENDTNAKH